MKKTLVYTAALLLSVNVFAGNFPIKQWLVVAGPDLSLPAFSETKNIKGRIFTEKELFEFSPIDISNHFPEENKVFFSNGLAEEKWTISKTDDSNYVELKKSAGNKNETAYLASYISTRRWIRTELEIHSRQMFAIYLNGKQLGSKTTCEAATEEPGKWTREIELPTGKHLILIRTFNKSDEESQWQVSGEIKVPSYAEASDIEIDLHPEQGKNINHLMNGIKAGSASLSPDGKMYAISLSRALPPSDRSENWMEIKQVSDGKLLHSFRHASISSLSWAPEGNIVSYRTTREGKGTIWMYDLDNGVYKTILEDIEDLGSWSWSPDGSFIIYSLQEKVNDDEGDLKRLIGMQDRLPGYRTRNFLYRIDIRTGIRERLTHGFLTTSLHAVSPCAKKILFSQSRPDYLERPYSKQDIFIMDLENKIVDTLFKDMRWGISGTFSPDAKQILFTGGPSAFYGAGENIPEGMIANNYDTQAYIYTLENGRVDPFTRDFDPSISQAVWSKSDNLIYLLVGEEDYGNLYRYDPKNRRFTKMNTGEEVINRIMLANNESVLVYAGSGMSSPLKVSLLDMKTGRYRELENPEKDNFRHVVFGESMEWEFDNDEGITIPGRVYLPPDFDTSKKYPLLVYYYGGTNPVSRSFGGRYPFNMYAANGYVVYVLQPSGATGFGQKFSAMHVNNWGITVADEIIQGARMFIDGHPFIDASRVGCMGASYGGFMTMLLQARTDIFAAAISHAGISSISSYWGEGYWGYGYSAEASAGSYPWNNRELYVDQSPLFIADRITTPLLLLHGSSDTNVPVGESVQLYVALKLLGQPVELIKIDGEDHHIITYSKRIAWSNTKLAWFDKWLKGQPEWWQDLYPEKNY